MFLHKIAKLYHLCVASYYIYTYYFYCVVCYPKVLNSEFRLASFSYGGDAKFLTMWCWGFQIFYFVFCVVTDLVDSVTSDPRSSVPRSLAGFRDWFLCSIAFPACLVVVLMFWSLWSIDRELVFPKALDEFYPMWINHVMHTNLLPILLVDIWLGNHKLPFRRLGLTTLFVASSLYVSWILWLGFMKNIWVYPILRVLSGTKFGFFVVAGALTPLPVYFIGEKCISLLQGPAWKKEGKFQKEA